MVQDMYSPFFIICCPRSGSSLLSKMLNSHPNIAVPPETHFFDGFYSRRKYYGDLALPEHRERFIDDVLSMYHMSTWQPPLDKQQILRNLQRNDIGGVFEGIIASWAQAQGKRKWGEKTPQHLYYWRDIRTLFPNMRVIHIVRDGRDVALSFLEAFAGPKTIYTAALRWASDLKKIAEIRESLNPQNFYELRYEDLLESPCDTLEALCAFLGEDYSAQMLEFYKGYTPKSSEKTNLKNLYQPLIENNKGKWHSQMNTHQLRIFEAVAGKYLKDYGYETFFSHPPTLSLGRVFFEKYIKKPPIKLLAMFQNRRSQLYEFQRLRILLRLRYLDRIKGA